jgi:hypothetical protein
MMSQDFGGGLDAVEPRQANIHQHQIWAMLFDEQNGAGAIVGFSHHAKFRAAVEDCADAISHDLVVIDE